MQTLAIPILSQTAALSSALTSSLAAAYSYTRASAQLSVSLLITALSAARYTVALAAAVCRLTYQITAPFAGFFGRAVLVLCSPAIEVAKYLASWLAPVASFIAALQPLYTFFGVAVIIGVLFGTLCFAVSTIFATILSLDPHSSSHTAPRLSDTGPTFPASPARHPLTPPRRRLPSFNEAAPPSPPSPPHYRHPPSPPPSPTRKIKKDGSPTTPRKPLVRAAVGETQRKRLAQLALLQREQKRKQGEEDGRARARMQKGVKRTIPETIAEER